MTLAQRVREHGWLHLRADQDDLASVALSIAKILGEPIPSRTDSLIESLSPMHIEQARQNSLSIRHGLSAFPPHIDGAHYLKPPQFVLLACELPGLSPTPTVLARFGDLLLNDEDYRWCESAVFLVRNRRKSFYSTMIDGSRSFVRFDPGCMTPMSGDGLTIMKKVALRAIQGKRTLFNWQAGDILVIDNWHVLHGRGLPSSFASPDRRLLRVSIQ